MKSFFSRLLMVIFAIVILLSGFHAVHIAKKTYSEPTLFLTATGKAGDQFIFDDFR